MGYCWAPCRGRGEMNMVCMYNIESCALDASDLAGNLLLTCPADPGLSLKVDCAEETHAQVWSIS